MDRRIRSEIEAKERDPIANCRKLINEWRKNLYRSDHREIKSDRGWVSVIQDT